MKLAFLFLLLSPILAFSQNWSPLNLDTKYNYQQVDSNYISNTLWIDSSETINGDLVFHLNRIVKDCLTCPQDAVYKLKNQGQFLQEKMIKTASGLYCFEGNQNFCIKADAELNESWTFDASQNIQASISSLGEELIFGNLDSVKTIQLSNSKEIKLSKNHGIVFFQDLNDEYSIVGMENPDLGEQVPRIIDFYDFEVGDVFQYQYSSDEGTVQWSQGIKKHTILNTNIVDSTLVYSVYEIKVDTTEYPFEPGPYIITQTTDTLEFVISDIYKRNYNDQVLVNTDRLSCGADFDRPMLKITKLAKDNATNRVSLTTGRSVSRHTSGNPYFLYSTSHGYLATSILSDTIKQQFIFCTPQTYLTGNYQDFYSTGLGKTYYHKERQLEVENTLLIGYVKNGNTTGVVTSDEVLLPSHSMNAEDIKLRIQPNYSTGIFNMYYTVEEFQNFEIINTVGQIVYKGQLQPNSNQLEFNIQEQTPGLYFLVVYSEDSVKSLKLIKQ